MRQREHETKPKTSQLSEQVSSVSEISWVEPHNNTHIYFLCYIFWRTLLFFCLLLLFFIVNIRIRCRCVDVLNIFHFYFHILLHYCPVIWTHFSETIIDRYSNYVVILSTFLGPCHFFFWKMREWLCFFFYLCYFIFWCGSDRMRRDLFFYNPSAFS